MLVDSNLENFFLQGIDFLDWFSHRIDVRVRLLTFNLGDEEVTGRGLVSTKGSDSTVIAREHDTLVIGGRNCFHRVDPQSTQNCVIWCSNVVVSEFDGFCDTLGVHAQVDCSDRGL